MSNIPAPTTNPQFMLEALMDSLIAFARAGAKGPSEIALPTRDYLWLAADLNIEDMTATPRITVRPDSLVFDAGTPGAKVRSQIVRVPESFVFQGPSGPVTIREHKENRNG